MKRILLFAFVLGFVFSSFAQNRVNVPADLRNKAAVKVPATAETMNFSNEVSSVAATPNYKNMLEETTIGTTWYDLQSNSSMQSRIYKYDDGTIGATFTLGYEHPGFSDRGTGYNYFDGTDWGPYPTARIESEHTGWPAYAAWGENGEIVVAHTAGNGLAISTRPAKGTGTWDEMIFAGPAGHEGLLWPRMTTGGVDHSVIHMIPLTRPTPNGGVVYEDMDGAILYSRSSDGGATWDPENELLEEINGTNYFGFSGDSYEIEAQGDNVAILAGDSWTDLVMMKSEDGGDTWEKTVIWQNPYPLYNTVTPNQITDTFYCADGAHDLAFDLSGKVHVVFGINRALNADGTGLSWFPLVDGLGYWNEDMATFSDDHHSLDPYGHPDSELVENESLIGWAQDINNNGVWDILGEVGLYYLGTSSMPTVTIDDQNRIYVVFSSITETFNNNVQDYRHLWARSSYVGGGWGPFVDLTSSLPHIFDECVFPSLSTSSDDYLYLTYQVDSEPGLAVRGDEDPYAENNINFMKIEKTEIPVSVEEREVAALYDYDVSEITPNPVSSSAKIHVNLRQATTLTLEVTNMMGQVVQVQDKGDVRPGMSTFDINSTLLPNGVYFCTVKAGGANVTKKMIVE